MGELSRILSLPRRATGSDLSVKWTARLGPNAKRPLFNHQAQCLEDAVNQDGGLFALGVGDGKTLLAMLLPEAMGHAGKAVLLLPSGLIDQARRDHAEWLKEYPVTPPTLVSYEQLSMLKNRTLLEEMAPSLIICDEAHMLGNATAARTKRFMAYMIQAWDTKFVAMSGSFGPSLSQYYHLAMLALGDGSPLPVRDIVPWCMVLDAGSEPSETQVASFQPLCAWAGHQETTQATARRAYYSRLASTPGVVWSDSPELPVNLTIRPWSMPVTPTTAAAGTLLDTLWTTPNERVLISAAEVWMHAANLPYGVYTDWDWDAVGGYDAEWDEARKAWGREISYLVADGVSDSPAEVETMAEEGSLRARSLRVWAAWDAIKDRVDPPERFVVYDAEQVDLVRRTVAALPAGTLVWYTSRAVASILNGVVDVYGAGQPQPTDTSRVIAVSSRVFGTGWHAAAFHRNVILQPNLSTRLWQQLLGRTHRTGQDKDVEVLVAAHTPALRSILASAVQKAKENEELHGVAQKLTRFTW